MMERSIGARQIIHRSSSLEIGSHDIEELTYGLSIERVRVFFGIDQVGAHVVLDHLCRQSCEGSAHAREKVHDLLATRLALEGTFDGVDLPSDAAHAR